MEIKVKPLRFALVYLAVVAALIGLQFGLGLIGINLPAGGISTVLPALFGGYVEGAKTAEASGTPATGGAAWNAAAKLAAVVFAINAALAALLLTLPDARVLMATVGTGTFVALFFILLGLSWLIIRFGMWQGSKLAMAAKAQDRSK